jgi:Zn ribbon nucleic-acid-binding protein
MNGKGAGMKYDRTVIAYHGCDAEIAERLLHGEPFKMSQNDYDWLGEGFYLWEYGADRALQFAHDQKARGKVETPAIVGALVQLGRCFDLMDTQFTDELPIAFAKYKQLHRQSGQLLPENRGKTPDKLLRHRDCAVLNFYLRWLPEHGVDSYDTVRCGFVEGPPAYAGSSIRHQSHVQIAVRNPACVVGVFRPTMRLS